MIAWGRPWLKSDPKTSCGFQWSLRSWMLWRSWVGLMLIWKVMLNDIIISTEWISLPSHPTSFPNSIPFSKYSSLIQNEAFREIVRMDRAKGCIYILDREQFEDRVLPGFYRHGKLTSFVRQLNLYGFKKLKNTQLMAFTHPVLAKGGRYAECFVGSPAFSQRKIWEKWEETKILLRSITIFLGNKIKLESWEERRMSGKRDSIALRGLRGRSSVVLPTVPWLGRCRRYPLGLVLFLLEWWAICILLVCIR